MVIFTVKRLYYGLGTFFHEDLAIESILSRLLLPEIFVDVSVSIFADADDDLVGWIIISVLHSDKNRMVIE
jgi:hypothetical protein